MEEEWKIYLFKGRGVNRQHPSVRSRILYLRYFLQYIINSTIYLILKLLLETFSLFLLFPVAHRGGEPYSNHNTTAGVVRL